MDSAKYVPQHKRIYINIGKNKEEQDVQYNKMCRTVYCVLNK